MKTRIEKKLFINKNLKIELDNILTLSCQYTIRQEFNILKTKLGNVGASKRASDIINKIVSTKL